MTTDEQIIGINRTGAAVWVYQAEPYLSRECWVKTDGSKKLWSFVSNNGPWYSTRYSAFLVASA